MAHDDEDPILSNLSVNEYQFEQTGDNGREVTIDEYYNHAGFGVVNVVITVGAGVAVFMYSALIQWITLVTLYFGCSLNITMDAIINIKSSVLWGMIIGLPLSGLISDRIGRRLVNLWGAYVITIFWALSAISNLTFAVSFFFVGAGFGSLLTSSLVYAWEYSSVEQHSRVTLILFGMYILGELWSILMFHFLIGFVGWHWLTILLGIPLISLFLFYHLSPDTPKYLSISGLTDRAYIILLKLHTKNRVPMLRGKLKSSEITNRGRCCQPCDPEFLKPTILLMFIYLLLNFGYYGMSYGVVVSLKTTGYCGNEKQKSFCQPNSSEELIESLFGLIPDAVGLIFAMFLSEVCGRKVGMMVLAVIAGVACLAATYCLGFVVSAVQIAIARGFSFGALTLLYMYTVEVYTTNIRCISLSYLWISGLLGMFISGSVGQGLKTDTMAVLICTGVMLLVSCVPMYFLEKVHNKDVDSEIDEQARLNPG